MFVWTRTVIYTYIVGVALKVEKIGLAIARFEPHAVEYHIEQNGNDQGTGDNQTQW